jgi:hypothetical protein
MKESGDLLANVLVDDVQWLPSTVVCVEAEPPDENGVVARGRVVAEVVNGLHGVPLFVMRHLLEEFRSHI